MPQQPARPAIAAAYDAWQPADLGCSCRGLRVDQARCHRVPIGKGPALCLGQPTCHQVAQPTLQLGHAHSDPLGSLRRPHSGSLWVDDCPLPLTSTASVRWHIVIGRRRSFPLVGSTWLRGTWLRSLCRP